jgi:hypothetical protein
MRTTRTVSMLRTLIVRYPTPSGPVPGRGVNRVRAVLTETREDEAGAVRGLGDETTSLFWGRVDSRCDEERESPHDGAHKCRYDAVYGRWPLARLLT